MQEYLHPRLHSINFKPKKEDFLRGVVPAKQELKLNKLLDYYFKFCHLTHGEPTETLHKTVLITKMVRRFNTNGKIEIELHCSMQRLPPAIPSKRIDLIITGKDSWVQKLVYYGTFRETIILLEDRVHERVGGLVVKDLKLHLYRTGHRKLIL